jgi:hypothetical protein
MTILVDILTRIIQRYGTIVETKKGLNRTDAKA